MMTMTGKTLKNRILAPILLVFLIVSGLCVGISLPPVWHAIYRHNMEEKLEKYASRERLMHDALLISDSLWRNESYEAVDAKLQNHYLNAKEKSHFEDVRGMLRKALGAFVVILAGFVLLRKHLHWRTVWSHALLICLGMAFVFGVWSVIAWRSLFRALHWVAFRDGSWILPGESYSLFLYPHALWQNVGAWISGMIFLILMLGYGVSRVWGKK